LKYSANWRNETLMYRLIAASNCVWD